MSEKTYDVYGIGNAIIDLQLQVADADIQRFGMKKGAMQLVDTTAQKALLEHFHGQNLNQASGGSAANTMIAIAQLGGRAAYGCLVGDDSFGSFYLEEMAQLGIDVATAPLEDSMTGTCVILITPDAERTMNTHLGASAQFSAQHVHEPAIAAAEWLYVEGYLFASEEGRQAAKRAIALAKSHGTKVALTVSDGFIVEVFGEPLRQAIAQSDLLFANLNEAQIVTGRSDEDAVFSALGELVPQFCLTLRERGARVLFNGSESQLAAYDVRALDETGAGDMFAGGFLYGVTHGLSATEAGKLSCFLASRVVAQVGPRLLCDLKQFEEVHEFLPALHG